MDPLIFDDAQIFEMVMEVRLTRFYSRLCMEFSNLILKHQQSSPIWCPSRVICTKPKAKAKSKNERVQRSLTGEFQGHFSVFNDVIYTYNI